MNAPEIPKAYIDQVRSGELVAGKLVRLAVERHVRDLSELEGFWFDEKAGSDALAFFDLLRHWKGEWSGQAFELTGWQAFCVWSLYGWKHSGSDLRRFRVSYVEVARKNGKTTLAAGLGLLMLVGDDEPGAEVYTAATKKDQAIIMHEDAVQMVKSSRALSARVTVLKNNLSVDSTGSKYRPLGADSRTLDGLNIHCGLIDELHAHPDPDLYEVMATGTGARRQPLMASFTTAGAARVSFCYDTREYGRKVLEGQLEDPRFFAFIAALDEGDDWKDEATWPKANPNLGVSVKLETLREERAEAIARPSKQNFFRRYKLNQWIAARTRFLSLDRWDQCAGPTPATILAEELKGRPCWAGLDLSSKVDFTALALVFRDGSDYDALFWHWVPEARIDFLSDLCAMPFRQWIDEGWLETTPGERIDFQWILERLFLIFEEYPVEELGFDPWAAGALTEQLQAKLGKEKVLEIIQGYRTLSAPTKDLEALVLDRGLRHGGNPIARWEADCLEVVEDPAGNLKPDRPSKGHSASRIDGMVALIMALDRAARRGPETESVYEHHGLESF